MKKSFWVLQHVDVDGSVWNQHNLHRTGHIQICKQGTVGSQSVV